MSNHLWPHGLYSPWNSPDQNTGVCSISLLQGIFPTQGSNPGLLHCRWFLYQLSHKGSPRTQVWVAYPFSRGSCQPRKQTGVSCIAGGSFINWAIREAQCKNLMTDFIHILPFIYLLLFLSFINFYFYFIHKVLLLVLFQTANSLLYLHFPFLFLLSVITVLLSEFPLMFLLVWVC